MHGRSPNAQRGHPGPALQRGDAVKERLGQGKASAASQAPEERLRLAGPAIAHENHAQGLEDLLHHRGDDEHDDTQGDEDRRREQRAVKAFGILKPAGILQIGRQFLQPGSAARHQRRQSEHNHHREQAKHSLHPESPNGSQKSTAGQLKHHLPPAGVALRQPAADEGQEEKRGQDSRQDVERGEGQCRQEIKGEDGLAEDHSHDEDSHQHPGRPRAEGSRGQSPQRTHALPGQGQAQPHAQGDEGRTCDCPQHVNLPSSNERRNEV